MSAPTMERLEPLLDWAKRTACYPREASDLAAGIEGLGRIEDLASGAEALRRDLSGAWKKDADSVLEQHQVDYTRLFITRWGGVPAPPFASFYLDGELAGPSLQWVTTFYRRWGLNWVRRDGIEMADHIAVELEFLQFLGHRSWRSAERGDGPRNAWIEFQQQHLNRWVPRLAERIAANARAPIYRFLASVLLQLDFKEN